MTAVQTRPTFSEAAAKDLRKLAMLREAMRTGILPPPKPVTEVKRQRGLLLASLTCPGTWIDHYHLDARLGHGGQGAVLRATDRQTGQDVTLKLYHSPRQATRTAGILTSLHHPRLPAFIKAGTMSGYVYHVFAYYHGQSLTERLQYGPLSAVEATRVSDEIAEALQALHDQRIVHRDLGARNVLLTPSGAVLLDFGHAMDFR